MSAVEKRFIAPIKTNNTELGTSATKRPVERLAYNISDAAKALGIGRTTIYRMIADDQLATFTVRGMRRVATIEIDRVLKGEARKTQFSSNGL